MTQNKKENSDSIPSPYVLLKARNFEEHKDNILLLKILEENENLKEMAKTINESKKFKGQNNSREDIIKMVQSLTDEEKKYAYTFFFPDLEKKDKYFIFYYLEKSFFDNDKNNENENEDSYQKVEEEMNKYLERDYGVFTGEEYQNFTGEENSISKEETKEETDKNPEVNEKIDEKELKKYF